MKIGCTGAGGTGKTTIATMLAEKLNLPFFPSVVRGVYQSFGLTEKDNGSLTPDQMEILQLTILRARQEEEKKYTEFISDRTLIDHVAYAIYVCEFTKQEVERWRTVLEKNLSQYDAILYFPVEDGWFPEENDPFRSSSYKQALILDGLIATLMGRYTGPVLWMPKGSPQKRLKKALKDIDFYMREMK